MARTLCNYLHALNLNSCNHSQQHPTADYEGFMYARIYLVACTLAESRMTWLDLSRIKGTVELPSFKMFERLRLDIALMKFKHSQSTTILMLQGSTRNTCMSLYLGTYHIVPFVFVHASLKQHFKMFVNSFLE